MYSSRSSSIDSAPDTMSSLSPPASPLTVVPFSSSSAGTAEVRECAMSLLQTVDSPNYKTDLSKDAYQF